MSKKLVFALFLVVLLLNQSLVEAGKKKLLMGLALGHALRARDHHSLLRILIPLRLVNEAWKNYGKYAAHHHHYDDYDYGHHHHGHFDHHFDHFDHHHHHGHDSYKSA